ncbi:hypothetical protein Pint_21723 [Pistacia integerrima]|uniref:Uncharacterized protein n=1 Tax=Pistacia integerrima TaxID=434235 RepID=A0ACC0XBS6_9ROSI|nr:hypothetical protein Pint_21723 [Pistacia integerrima]
MHCSVTHAKSDLIRLTWMSCYDKRIGGSVAAAEYISSMSDGFYGLRQYNEIYENGLYIITECSELAK